VNSPHPAWTPARFRSFIVSALRSASNRYPPKYTAKKAAWLERGKYLCAGYNKKPHKVGASIKVGKKRVNNVSVDHISPVIGPEGFVDWNTFIGRLFCTADNLQVLCKDCHDRKSKDEKIARRNEQ
jgi:hypothetical protein